VQKLTTLELYPVGTGRLRLQVLPALAVGEASTAEAARVRKKVVVCNMLDASVVCKLGLLDAVRCVLMLMTMDRTED